LIDRCHLEAVLESSLYILIDRCHLEAVLEREGRKSQLNSETSHNHSRDSAIDTDLQEWETETLEFNFVSFITDIGVRGGGGATFFGFGVQFCLHLISDS